MSTGSNTCSGMLSRPVVPLSAIGAFGFTL